MNLFKNTCRQVQGILQTYPCIFIQFNNVPQMYPTYPKCTSCQKYIPQVYLLHFYSVQECTSCTTNMLQSILTLLYSHLPGVFQDFLLLNFELLIVGKTEDYHIDFLLVFLANLDKSFNKSLSFNQRANTLQFESYLI